MTYKIYDLPGKNIRLKLEIKFMGHVEVGPVIALNKLMFEQESSGQTSFCLPCSLSQKCDDCECVECFEVYLDIFRD